MMIKSHSRGYEKRKLGPILVKCSHLVAQLIKRRRMDQNPELLTRGLGFFPRIGAHSSTRRVRREVLPT